MVTDKFNEDTRVKIPAILTLTRLGYGYLSLKGGVDIDTHTNIFKNIFFESLRRLNPGVEDNELQKLFLKIQTMLNNDDLGKEFYNLLTNSVDIKLIDWDTPSQNTLNVCTELTYGSKGGDTFRPDITLLINGMPLAFIEVKKPNNREGIIAERDRINDRFKNRKFRRYINISQILMFSNNMEYEDGDVDPIQGAFYAAVSRGKAFFNQFKEEVGNKDHLLGLLKDEDERIEMEVLADTNYMDMRHNRTFVLNKDPGTPTNRTIISLFATERMFDILRYSFAYVEYDDEDGVHHLEKHIMRYPQFFASKAIQAALDKQTKCGIIWHTQGSGKTALAYFNVHWLTDYFAKKNIIPKFYFIVDRIDLRNQASSEFVSRGLTVNTIERKDDLIKDLKRGAVLKGNTGEREITVLNIQKFSEDAQATSVNDYNINVQRIYFIDEAHRSYKLTGSFLANLIQSDPNAIIISLTGTPLLDKDGARIPRASKKIFGDYIHKYYYNQSINDGYTLRLIREEIETKYKLQLLELIERTKIREGDVEKKHVLAHKSFCVPLLEYIVSDLRSSRIRHNNDQIGGMIVCDTSTQAEMLAALFKEIYENRATDNHTPNTAALILHNEGDTQSRKDDIKSFKNGKIDLLFVFNMLLTGFDAPRLKRLYLGRVVKEHNLLQALTRVNRPYDGFRYGYVVDFADIRKEFDKTNKAYWKELHEDWGKDFDGYENLFKTPEEIERDIEAIKDALWQYDTVNVETFQRQISEIKDKKDLFALAKALRLAVELYNLIRLSSYNDLLEKLDFRTVKKLLAEVENRTALINHRELLQNGYDITSLLNEPLENAIFVFKKTSEGSLDLTSNALVGQLRKTREAMERNHDKEDPLWIFLKEELERLLHGKNWEEAESEEIEAGLRILEEIYGRISELNRKDGLLVGKYDGDTKYLRIHKWFMRQELSKNEKVVFDILMGIKRDMDEQLKDANIMSTPDYFEIAIQQAVVSRFKNTEIRLNPEVVKSVRDAIVKVYINEHGT